MVVDGFHALRRLAIIYQLRVGLSASGRRGVVGVGEVAIAAEEAVRANVAVDLVRTAVARAIWGQSFFETTVLSPRSS